MGINHANSHRYFDTGTRRCTRVHTYIYSAFIQAHYTLGSSTQQQGGGGKGCVALPTSPSDRKNLVPRSVRTGFAPVFADVHLFGQTWNSDRKIRGQNRGSRDPPPGNRHGHPSPPRSSRAFRARPSQNPLIGVRKIRRRGDVTRRHPLRATQRNPHDFIAEKRAAETTVTNIDLNQKK